MKNRFLLFALAIGCCLGVSAKKPLDHDSFDSWQSVSVAPLSQNGKWAAYMVNPQEGDGVLTFRNTRTGKEVSIARGYQPSFTADGQWAIALIKPFYADTRAAKIKKKKDFDLPQDSLALVNLSKGTVEKIANVQRYRVGLDGGDWVVYSTSDTTYIKPKALKDKKAGKPLIARHLPTGRQKVTKWVKNWSVSRDGQHVGIVIEPQKKDSVTRRGVALLSLRDTSYTLLDRGQKHYGTPVFSRASDQMAFIASNDSNDTGTRRNSLYRVDLRRPGVPAEQEYKVALVPNPEVRLMRPPTTGTPEQNDSILRAWQAAQRAARGDSLFINQYSELRFSRDGNRLIVGVAPTVLPNDTNIVDFEQAALDIWRWDAPYTPPQEEVNRKKLREHTMPLVIDLSDGSQRLVTANSLVDVVPSDLWAGDNVLLRDPSQWQVTRQWDYVAPEDLTILNLRTGATTSVGESQSGLNELSPMGKYVVMFKDRDYYAFDPATGKTVNLTADIEYPLWDEDQDIPMQRMPYGFAGWTKDDGRFLVYDRYDIWSLDPTGKTKPVNFTAGAGRRAGVTYRYLKTDREERYLTPGQDMLLRVFRHDDKQNGLALAKAGTAAAPKILSIEPKTFSQIARAKNAPVYAFRKADFSTSPQVFIATDNNFAKARQVTDANPQMADYSWGDAQLVKWYAYNGDLTEGVLYTPEDLDPNKKYPMLVVFYERNSENLYLHYTMEPSWSWVNYPFYVSRGYVVFVPDIKYAPGIPGESAYNYVCSGVEDLCKRFPFIDKEKIGIDGQSWGGYQTAYLVTRTNMFACAGSGAPVSNMTSAFGGIRWGSGDSRQGQYELGQSRIGRNLWEAPQLYIANSPVFYADRVETPLLIMANDADGAVPWYQGIEMFMALRRLQKPVWMLQYNGEAHNIRARKNRKDITKRLQGFFDHYLKGDPMPRWMKEGIDPVRKGQDLGF